MRKESVPFCAAKDIDRNFAIERLSASGIELVKDFKEVLFLEDRHLNSFSYVKR